MLAGSLLGKRCGQAIPEPGMLPVAVVEDLEVFRDLLSGLFPYFMSPVLHELILQRPPDALHRRVAVAVSSTRYRDTQPHVPQPCLVGMRAILGATIGAMNKPWPRALGGEGLPERPRHEVRRYSGVHRMADHLVGEQILDAGEI